jgi:hypothetical protein
MLSYSPAVFNIKLAEMSKNAEVSPRRVNKTVKMVKISILLF